ncbi:hypothetical protein NONO_c43440 [Nocardia nova SH22a]|uniref:Uncharacterized protein n=2 Tax=Nocardia nova TaxID=37330 RepID=W5TJH2_9NOCA|nr:hypothetical protein NONO_c43440 [Nocardia nova SH22a]
MAGEEEKASATGRRSIIFGAAAAGVGVAAGVAATKVTAAEEDTTTAEGSFTIVDRRGRQRFLFDSEKPPIILGGKTIPSDQRSGEAAASYLIFNDENGNEKGGIVAHSSGAQLSFDYPNQDALHLGCRWRDKTGGAELVLNHIGDPAAPSEQQKFLPGVELFVDNQSGTGLNLCDQQGRPRIRLQVAMDGTPSIAILDEQGAVIRQL